MLVDVGLTWRVSSWVIWERVSRTTVRTRVSTSLWEVIAGMLLKVIQDTGMALALTWCYKKASSIARTYS